MARAIGEWSWVFNKKLLQGDSNHMSYMWKAYKVSRLGPRIRCAMDATSANGIPKTRNKEIRTL